jgi:hypothetical protein
MKATLKHRESAAIRKSDQKLISYGDCGQKLFAIHVPFVFGRRQRRRDHNTPRMRWRHAVEVIQLEAVRHRSIRQSCIGS